MSGFKLKGWKQHKKFGKHYYIYKKSYSDRKDAKQHAEWLRRRGFYVRIVKGIGLIWHLYMKG